MRELEERREERKTDRKTAGARSLRINWKKWFRRDNLIVLVLSGILLFIIALPTERKAVKEENASGGRSSLTDIYGQEKVAGTTGSSDAGTASGSARNGEDWMKYAGEQEKRLADILSVMDGVGRVEVMLTFASTEELVVEREQAMSRSDTREEDAAGGSRSVAAYDRKDAAVYRTADGDSEPYVVKTLLPRVEGVLVVAEGAGNANIRKAITQIAEALFGVEAHKVVVVPMETGGG